MESFSVLFFRCTIFLVLCLSPNPIYARDTITQNTPLRDDNANQTLVSAGGIFELGFFTPPGSTKSSRYVGIWYYNLDPRRIVWVANRDKPLSDFSGLFCIADDGRLKLFSNKTAFPIVEFGDAGDFNRIVKLLDNGNLVIFEGSSPSRSAKLWQSFNNATDTFLPGMKMDDNMVLTSWLNPTDPASGNYTFQREDGLYTIQNGSDLYWRSGEPGLSKIIPDKIPYDVANFSSGLSKEYERNYQSSVKQKRIISFNFTGNSNYNLSGIFLNSMGGIQYYRREGARWIMPWSEPQDNCSVYNSCGKFKVCDINSRPRCHCLPEFQPDSTEDSSYGDCVRMTQITCDKSKIRRDKSKFLNLSLRNFGGRFQPFMNAKNEEECKKECLRNCKCEAYSFSTNNPMRRGSSNFSCYIGTGDLENLQSKHGEGGHNLHVLVADVSFTGISSNASSRQISSNSLSKQKKEGITISAVIAAVLLVCCFSYNIYRRKWMTKEKESGENTEENPVLWSSHGSNTLVPDSTDEDNKSGVGVPFYNWESILIATENFSDVHKLGRGGFGPVYKGMFSGGREMAVKRLSSYSAQGINEFRNEVVLISKLQHRNLVRLLGYCIKHNEKILLYEYMPNKSLDAFIFGMGIVE